MAKFPRGSAKRRSKNCTTERPKRQEIRAPSVKMMLKLDKTSFNFDAGIPIMRSAYFFGLKMKIPALFARNMLARGKKKRKECDLP